MTSDKFIFEPRTMSFNNRLMDGYRLLVINHSASDFFDNCFLYPLIKSFLHSDTSADNMPFVIKEFI